MNEDLRKLIEKLPFFLHHRIIQHSYPDQLIEIILDLGRRPEARFSFGPEYLSQKLISWQDLDYTSKRISKFSIENRAGIERTLHRISCIRNRQFIINGLTCRVGRAIFGTISIIRDLLESNLSILILGNPGVGKTTIIREIARILSDELEKRVIVIDTANEIAGESDIPHSGIGRSRRMQVAKTKSQYQIMIEAVENHMPEVIIIDEIGTELEVLAACTITEKGVRLIGTTHGNFLENLIKNPSLSNLIGGIQYVTLSDEEAKRRGTQKSVLERKTYPAFEILIELNERNYWTVHEDVKTSIDSLLINKLIFEQVRQFSTTKHFQIKTKSSLYDTSFFLKNSNKFLENNWKSINDLNPKNILTYDSKTIMLYSYSLPYNLFKEVFSRLNFKVNFTNNISTATLIIGLKKHVNQNIKLKNLAHQTGIPLYTLTKVNLFEMKKLIESLN